jgi:hypothetical protein
MKTNLPARPNLDHLRRQAKTLLAALEFRETEAASTILNHLPAATKNEVRISFGGQTMIHALVKLDEGTDSIAIEEPSQSRFSACWL